MMNRQQRRAAKESAPKKKPICHNMTKQERIDALIKNGITIEDLKRSHDEGFNEGYRIASEDTVKAVYAALCLALNDLHGFGAERCKAVLRAVDERVLYKLTGEDIIEEVFQKFGFKITFNDPLERIEDK